MPTKRLLPMFFALLTLGASAQVTLPVPTNLQETYKKGTRTTSGAPGKNYWQNTANYVIQVSYSPATRLVNGTVEIDYVNNSPDTLEQTWFKLYPNLYKKGSMRAANINPADVTDGVLISSLKINNVTSDTGKLRISGTNMVIPITPTPLLPKQTIHFSINYSYTLNKTSHIRTGEIDANSAFIAYFFPRVAVYDDIDGWNTNPYIGSQEFYNDFCNFSVSISVPANFLVWATGDLTNCNEVLNETFCQRITSAEQNDAIIDIVDSAELKQKNITKPNSINTWKFTAANVPDFAFGVSDHYIWKSSSLVVDPSTKRRTRVDAVFNPAHKDYYEVIDFTRATVQAMSYTFPKWPFPYSHETVFDGLDQMEYPMMVNDNPLESREETIELVDHEVFHTMFPFYMGTNETKYGWMDEGWATIGEWLISSMIDSSITDEYGVKPYEQLAGSEIDLPITVLTTQQGGTAMFLNSYPKPGLGYLYVKDMLGDELFTKALHHYIRQWNGKHPMPYDFFNCMNVGSGKNLNWFWKKWFFEDGVPDLGISKVTKSPTGYNITIQKKGNKPVPVDLVITYTDGSQSKQHRSIAVWEKANTLSLAVTTKKTVKEISLGSTYVPDVSRADNTWTAK